MFVIVGEYDGFAYQGIVFHTDTIVHQPVQHIVDSIVVVDVFEYFRCINDAAIRVARF